jgi:hypothetical protein
MLVAEKQCFNYDIYKFKTILTELSPLGIVLINRLLRYYFKILCLRQVVPCSIYIYTYIFEE